MKLSIILELPEEEVTILAKAKWRSEIISVMNDEAETEPTKRTFTEKTNTQSAVDFLWNTYIQYVINDVANIISEERLKESKLQIAIQKASVRVEVLAYVSKIIIW